MWKEFSSFLIANPIISIFLALAGGYFIGKFKIKSFSLGSTVGALLVGLLVGQLGIFTIAPILKSVFFDLFIFVVGYEVGPAFIQSLKSSGLKLVVQSVFFSVVGFGVAIILFKLFKLNAGEAAGIIAGSLTQSATIGTATSAINGLNISAAAKATMTSNVAIAYAVTYVFGTMGVTIFLKNIAPVLLRVNLKDETKKMVESLDIGSDDRNVSPLLSNMSTRSFQILQTPKENLTISRFEKDFHNKVIVQQVFSKHKPQTFDSHTVLKKGQVLTVLGESEDLWKVMQAEVYYKEVFDDAYRKIPLRTVELMLTNVFSHHALSTLIDENIVVIDATRDGKKIEDLSTLTPGDRLTIAGPDRSVKKVLPTLGYAVDNSSETDVTFMSIGIVLGILIGTLVLTIGGIPLTLGAGGGALFSGIFFGWYQNKKAYLGNIPSATRWFLKSVGLNLFIAAVGLEAGSQFVKALGSMGIQVLLIGAVISILPHVITLFFSKYVLKLNAIDNIGSLTGAGTINAALNAVSEETQSSVFSISFTPAYAIGNVLLTIMGPLVVALLG